MRIIKSITGKKPSYMCLELLNYLPNEVKIFTSLKGFKTKVNKILINLQQIIQHAG